MSTEDGYARERVVPRTPSNAYDPQKLLGQHFPKQLIKNIQLMEKQS